MKTPAPAPFTDRNGIAVDVGTRVMVVRGDPSCRAGSIGYICSIKHAEEKALVSDNGRCSPDQHDWVWAGWMAPEDFVVFNGDCPVPVDPDLPDTFWTTPNDRRPASHLRWWDRPFVQVDRWRGPTDTALARRWLANWPSGARYDLYCLDGGAWDRPTSWGSYATLEEATAVAVSRRLSGRSHGPLVITGPGGEFTREVRECQACGGMFKGNNSVFCPRCISKEIRG